jgi:hypothetical protein
MIEIHCLAVSNCRCDKAEPLANRRRVPQPRASCGQHLRQDKPLERPGGAGALVLMNEALMLRSEQRGVEPGERDENFCSDWI